MVTKHSLKGHITVECIDRDNNVIDKFESNNLIMDASRIAMARMTAGINTSSKINKFILGTKGHVGEDYLSVKTEVDGFVGTRTSLFSEESNDYTYSINFSPTGVEDGQCTIDSETNIGGGSTVYLNVDNKTVEYTIQIFENAANNTGINVFTEAALYAGNNIFSMKCFPGKIKDNTVSLKIVWKIMF